MKTAKVLGTMRIQLLPLGWLVWLASCMSSGETAVDAGAETTGGSGGASGSDTQLDGRASGPDGSVLPDGGGCRWPQAAVTYSEASGSGCTPRSAFLICQVPNGGSMAADGAIFAPDGSLVADACTNACAGDEYALNCRGPLDAGAPDPDPSLACGVIPIPGNLPTSMNYCCRCAT
jgi:hypothetical protein